MTHTSARRGLLPIAGTDLAAPRGARRLRLQAPDAPLELTLHLRSREADPEALVREFEAVTEGRRAPLSHPEFAVRFGAERADIALVRRFAATHGFRVTKVSVPRRLLRLRGTGRALADAFGVHRVRYRLDGVTWNSFVGPLHVPQALADVVLGVFGFDERPDLARRRAHSMSAASTSTPAPTVSYTPPELARLYGFPKGLDGAGVAIGVIALGGGYLETDLRTYFRALGLRRPCVRAHSVDGARNAPRGATAAYDGEVTGDIETVGAIAPGARITVYFAANTVRGFFEAVAAAVHDGRRRNAVLSISWGQNEMHWRRSFVHAFDRVLMEAAVLGITVCCSSGDFGAFADLRDRTPHVNFPGSSPHVLSCGGTTLHGTGTRIARERVWHNAAGASGGGVSAIFARPSWQSRMRVPRGDGGRAGRGVPDVAANADPLTGYRCYVHGRWIVGAGTSAAAPLWAGLVALINQQRGARLGLPTPHLYRRFGALVRAGALVPITQGSNGRYRARRGWDCCTGLGTPRGKALAKAMAHRAPTR